TCSCSSSTCDGSPRRWPEAVEGRCDGRVSVGAVPRLPRPDRDPRLSRPARAGARRDLRRSGARPGGGARRHDRVPGRARDPERGRLLVRARLHARRRRDVRGEPHAPGAGAPGGDHRHRLRRVRGGGVTSSVRLAGVLLVFAYLIVPATAAAVLARSARGRLLVGWALGLLVSVAGLVASWTWDLPTGATVVVTFGVLVAAVAVALAVRAGARATRERGVEALRGPSVGLCAVVGVAGLMLVLVPRMDHWWLGWLEASWPVAQTCS